MSLESISRFAELTGKAPRTIKPLILALQPVIDGRSHLYETRDALPLIYGTDSDKTYVLEEERARLAHHQANNEALKEAENRGDLIRSDDVRELLNNMIMATKAKLLALPHRMISQVIAAESTKEIEETLKSEVHVILKELAHATDSIADDHPGGGDQLATAAPADG